MEKKLNELPKIAIIDPCEFKELVRSHPPEHYSELNKKYFLDLPREFYGELNRLLLKDWLELAKFFSNPLNYNPLGMDLLLKYYFQKIKEGADGLENLSEDMEVMFKLKSSPKFKVGVNVGATPKETFCETPLLNVYRYCSDAPKKPPVFIVYSYINSYYILDLAPGMSLVEHLVKEGFDVFITDWKIPKKFGTPVKLEKYIEEIIGAADKIREETKCDKIGSLGYCIGGVLLDIAVALYPLKFKYVINLTTGIDTKVGEDGTGIFGAYSDMNLADLKNFYTMNGGVFPGFMMTFFFDAVKPSKKAEQVFQTYIHGKKQELDEVLFWNAESSRDVPGLAHYEFLLEIYNKNSLARGEMELLGEKVDLKKITQPYLNVVARFDHIVPMPIGLKNAFLIGAPLENQTNIMVKGGHIRGVVNDKLFPFISSFAKKHI